MRDEASKKRLRRSLLALPVVIATISFVLYSSCGGNELNLFQPVAEPLAKDDPDAQMEEARMLMDEKKYEEAANLLEPLIDSEGKDSNEARLLYAAAELGVAKLDIWSIISSILDSQDDAAGSEASGGIDGIFNALSDTVLGTGADREARIEALVDAITTLRSAPDPDEPRVQNTACLLAGILAVPTLADAKTALDSATSALQSIRDAAQSGGTECPNLSLIETASTAVASASTKFSLVLQAAANCSFLNVQQAAAAMNTVEEQMRLLTDNTDKGCDSLPTCPAALPSCHDLFPTCVQQALKVGTSTAVAGDGIIAGCELMLNCTVASSCFK